MDNIKSFIKVHFQELKKKDKNLKTEEDAVEHLLNISLFHIKWKPNLFDWKRYINTFPDLRKNLKTSKDAVWHYLVYGIRERRKVYVLNSNEIYEHQFNWKDYVTINQDLKFLLTDIHCFEHYITQGYLQNRKTTMREQTIINDRIEISDNPSTNKNWLQLLTKHLKILQFEVSKKSDIVRVNDKIYTINHYNCINIENNLSYHELINHTNGDKINETNFVKNIIKNNITLYFNNQFITGNSKLTPQITISRNKNYDKLINKTNVYLSSIPYKKECNGLYFITKSMIDAIQDKNSLLYPHVYDHESFNELNKKPFFLNEQVVHKDWYNWATDDVIKQLKLKYFPEDAFVICICGRIAINSYPKSLLESIKILRQKGFNIHLLALTQFEVRPERLTQELYNEITSYKWVKSFTVDKKEVLNYFRICDILASTYRDYCNHVGGSNKIKEYLLCDKPILCSRGTERENELGKDYFGFYDSETCNTVPPLCWTQEYLKNPKCYKNQNERYFKNIDITKEVNQIIKIIETVKNKELIITITTYKRQFYLNQYLNLLQKQKYKQKYHIIVVNDDPTTNLQLSDAHSNVIVQKNPINYGKRGYYKNFAKNIRNIAFFTDNYIFSADDLEIKNTFLQDVFNYWNSIRDKKKIALTLTNDRESSWIPKKNENYNKNVMRSWWQETFFFCDNKFIKEYIYLDKMFSIPKSIKSSGVPRFFSINNYNKRYNSYVVKDQNFTQNIGIFNSQMNDYDKNGRVLAKIKKNYNVEKLKILIVTQKNGLSFLKEYISFIQDINCIQLQIDDQYEMVSNKNSQKHSNTLNTSKKLKEKLDTFKPNIIFCEWGSYLLNILSHLKRPDQKLICRIHRFDFYLQKDMLNIWNTNWNNIDLIITIAEYFEKEIINKFNFKNVITLNNYLNFDYKKNVSLDNKNMYNIGIIGIKEDRKRLDLALDILTKLRNVNKNYKLFSKGHNIENKNLIKNKITTDYFHEEHSDINGISVNKWVTNNKISHILSVSDSESFHYSMVTAIENNCNYYITNWVDIAKTMWNSECIYNNIDELVNGILHYEKINNNEKINMLNRNKNHCVNTFEFDNSGTFLDKIIL